MAFQNIGIDFDGVVNSLIFQENITVSVPASPNYPFDAAVKTRYVVVLEDAIYIDDTHPINFGGLTRFFLNPRTNTMPDNTFYIDPVVASSVFPRPYLPSIIEFSANLAAADIVISYYSIGTVLNSESIYTKSDVYTKAETPAAVQTAVDSYKGKRYTKTLTGNATEIEITGLDTNVKRYKVTAELINNDASLRTIDVQIDAGAGYITSNYRRTVNITSTSASVVNDTNITIGGIGSNDQSKFTIEISIINSKIIISSVANYYSNTSSVQVIYIANITNTGSVSGITKLKLIGSAANCIKTGSKLTIEEILDGKAV